MNSKPDLFKPRNLLVFYLIFLVLAGISFVLNIALSRPGSLGFLIISMSIPFFLYGIKKSTFVVKTSFSQNNQLIFIGLISLFYSFSFVNFFNVSLFVSIIASFTLFYSVYFLLLKLFRQSNYEKIIKKLSIILIGIGVVSFLLSLYQVGGVPLFNPALKRSLLSVVFYGLSLLVFPIGYSLFLTQIKRSSLFWLTIFSSTLLFSLSGFRTTILTIFLIGIITAYYLKKITNKALIGSVLFAVIVVIGIGFIASPFSLSPIDLLLYRAGSTYLVYDYLVQQGFPFGFTFGSLLTQANPRDYVGLLMGTNQNLTYSLLGLPVVEFGIIGVIGAMYLIGKTLSLSHSLMKENKLFIGLYALIFTTFLLAIETGIEQFHLGFVWFFLIIYWTIPTHKFIYQKQGRENFEQ